MAVQLRSIQGYYDTEAELWEHMALTRARVIAGDAELGAELIAMIRSVVTRPRDPSEVYGAVRSMRRLVAEEKGDAGPLDLKLAPGGLLDLDFLAQALVLAHGSRFPDLAGPAAGDVLALAAGHGLLKQAEAERLRTAYRQFDDVLHWQRLMVAGDPAQGSGVALTRLAVALGMPDAAHLMVQLDERRADVRNLFGRLLA